MFIVVQWTYYADFRDIQNLQQCIVTELEKCEEPTPANIVDSLFRFVRKQTPCASKPVSYKTKKNSSRVIIKLMIYNDNTNFLIDNLAIYK